MTYSIGGRDVGPGNDPFIILEAGINHNGELSKAKSMIVAAKDAGADAVKFQTFKAKEFVADHDQMFTYTTQGKEVTESMLEMFERYEFSRAEWVEIKNKCDQEGITFMSTPQNLSDLKLLLELGIPAIKIGSDDFTNLPLLESYRETGLPMIMSCGMADFGEIYEAICTTGADEGHAVILMLCTSQYPTPPEDVNMRKLKSLRDAFPNLLLGFSDHTKGQTAGVLAAGFGAVAYEKHFTLDHDLPGPDHWFSETPETAKIWVSSIREAHKMLGSARLKPTNDELKMRTLARRSVTTLRPIKAGELFDEANLGLLRPGNGLPPAYLKNFMGQRSSHDLQAGTHVSFSDIK